MDENDLLDESIVPDPDDPGDEYVLPEAAEFNDDPMDPQAGDSPDIEGGDFDRKEDNRE